MDDDIDGLWAAGTAVGVITVPSEEDAVVRGASFLTIPVVLMPVALVPVPLLV